MMTSTTAYEWAKKSKNRLNRENWKKNNQKNWTAKKPIKILKKPAGSVRFRFYKQKTEKTEPNRNKKNQKKTKPNRKNGAKTGKNQAKTEKTEPNRFEPVFALKNRTEPKPVGLTRFRFFFKKIWFGYFFW